jgi:excisionase family DNA binding protein
MSSEYYSLEKAAEVLALPTAEVNRLREKNQLRAFRDGSSWKFRKVDVDNFLAESIKNRTKNGKSSADSDFDLLGTGDSEESPTLLADSASFDSLMEAGLPFGGEMVDVTAPSPPSKAPSLAKPVTKKNDDFVSMDDDLMLGGDDLTLSDDSEVLPTAAFHPSASDIDLAAEDDLVPDHTGTSSGINLAGDSGLSLLDVADDIDLRPVSKGEGNSAKLELGDDDDILSLVMDEDSMEEDSSSATAISSEDDFQLTADSGVFPVDDSDSASQVIALDEDGVFTAGSLEFNNNPFGVAPISPEQSDGGLGMGIPNGSPIGSAAPDVFTAPVSTFTAPAAPVPVETNFTTWQLVALVAAVVLLIFPGVMILDLIFHIWSWNEPFILNSSLMDLCSQIVGLTSK